MADDLKPYRGILQQATERCYQSHIEAAAAGDLLAAGVWGAVFLEAFLEDVLRVRGISVSDRLDLNTAISRLRQEKDLANARDVLDHCEAVRIARNGLVHARANPGSSVEVHATTIKNYLHAILLLALPWFAGAPGRAEVRAAKAPPIVGRVFISTITPHLPRQEAFQRELEAELRTRGLEPVRVELQEFDQKDPVGKIVKVLNTCDALLCLGLARSHSYFLRDREGGHGEKEETHRYYTSGWMHLESGAAFALGIPVLVLCEASIASDGVFDRSWNSSQPYEIKGSELTVDDPAVKRCLDQLVEIVSSSPDNARQKEATARARPRSAPGARVRR
jgi:hypothetical protein